MEIDIKQIKLLSHLRKARSRALHRVVNPSRYLLDLTRLKLQRKQPTRVALISDAAVATSEEQFNCFSFCRAELRELNIISVHLLLSDVLRSARLMLRPFDVIVLKMSFRTDPKEVLNVVSELKLALNGRRLIYFDGDDDLCVQWPEILDHVDIYVKKHLFSDRKQYLKRYVGKSNLTDFVSHSYKVSFSDNPVSTETMPLKAEQLSKLRAGINLASDKKILKYYVDRRPHSANARENDIVFRGSVPNDWIKYLRRDIGSTLSRLRNRYQVITPDKRVLESEYYREMESSKICISPFGYGEICWRDFEAVLSGCLLVKPNMGHVETRPNIFRANDTYVPVQWDFADLEEKCSYYLEHEQERRRIVDQAFQVLDEFYKNGGMVEAVCGLLHDKFSSEIE